MWIFGQSIEKKQERAIRKEAKVLMKQLIEAGMNRQEAKTEMEKLLFLVMEACRQSKAYEKSKNQILFAQMLIEKLVEEVLSINAENEVNSREEVREKLKKLTSVLAKVFHECTIREDDTDFKMTCDYFNNVAENYDDSQRFMLQSELENLHYLLSEILQWEAPDFCALAYFCKFSDKSELGEVSNEQRNKMLLKYYKEEYWNEFERRLLAIGMKETVEVWIRKINLEKYGL